MRSRHKARSVRNFERGKTIDEIDRWVGGYIDRDGHQATGRDGVRKLS